MIKPHIKMKADSMLWGGNAHRGASTTTPDLSEWYAAAGSADGDLLPDLRELQARSRDIRRNNGFAHGLVETTVDYVVGSGIRFMSQPDWVRMSKADSYFSETWADEWSEQYEALYHEWFWSTACHAGDSLTGDQLTEQVLYSKFDNGGSLTLPLWLPKRGDGFATKLQTVEIDRLCNKDFAPNTTKHRGGIRFDDFGAPVAYDIRVAHPGDSYITMGMSAHGWVTVPRTTRFGRLRVIHDFDSDRADMTRGKPLLAAVLAEFKNIDRYVKAEIQAAVLNAMIWGAITTPLEHDDIVELFKGNEDNYMAARAKHAVKMKQGTLATLFPGDQLESFIPQRPNTQFGVFVENVEKIIAVGAGMPHLIAKKDFAKSNYSNTRAAMSELYRTVVRRRDRLGSGWLDKVNCLFMEEVVNDGRLAAPRWYEFKRSYLRGTWIGPPRGYVDKEKEVKGDVLALQANLTTFQRIAAEQGMHWKDLLRQCARERAFMAKEGLPDLAAVANPVVAVPEDPDEPAVDEGAAA
jgi:lambda family phage portal protein